MDLKTATENILFSENNFHLITQGIDVLYEKFSTSTHIYIGDLTHEHPKEISTGKIVTPVRAAWCLKDIGRTTHFLRGIYTAIRYYLNSRKSIRILYAGCGPYATLLTPFTSLFNSEEIRFTFLEIEQVSFAAVNKLYTDWKLQAYLDEVRLADATDQNIRFPEPFDIIISETMQMGLKNECQVPITRNLVRFLTSDGTFIPECISLDIYLTGPLDLLNPTIQKKEFLGSAYALDFRKVPPLDYKNVIEIPPSELKCLQLFTEIHLFGDEKLTVRQSGLTIPMTLDRFPERKPQSIEFTYKEGTEPGLSFDYIF